MTRAPATIGVCAIILLGLAMAACAGANGNTANGDCRPGVCVGSIPGSTPDSIEAHENLQ
jgi:hypothetical protein